MTLTITGTPQYANLPTMRLVVTSTTSVNTLVVVTRIHYDGSRHAVLTDQGPRLAGGAWTWLDIHCPYNQQVRYEVVNDGVTATSPPCWTLADKAFLVHAAVADLAVKIDAVAKVGDRATKSRAAEFIPIDSKAIYLTDGVRDGVSGTLEFRCSNEAPYREIFADDSVILLNTPATKGWPLGWMWIQPGDITYNNPGEINAYPYRHVIMPFRETSDPFADLEPAWISKDALAYWGGLGKVDSDLASRYATSLDFLTDTRI